jgi:4a-hydroxytetrahydrobiopterin dehydratase
MTDNPKVRLTSQQVEAEGLADWRILFDTLHARFETGSFATGLELVNRIGAAAEERNHHPDIDLTYPRVDVRLTSHDTGGVTSRDIELARTISGYAAELGAKADTASVQVLEIGLDTADLEEIKPFWAAVLGMDESEHDDLVDKVGRLPALWFQETEPHEVPRQRFHLDIRVPPEVAPGRIQAAIDAGGTLVTDEHAPRFWVLADPQGNKACVTTWQGREW